MVDQPLLKEEILQPFQLAMDITYHKCLTIRIHR